MAVTRKTNILLAVLAWFLTVDTPAQVFTSAYVPDSIWNRMQGRSCPKDCGVDRAELRYLELSYRDFDGNDRVGQMVCNRLIAEDMIHIFSKLYEAQYPIASIRLIDDFGASDSLSMIANNTSSFCHRKVSGTETLSKHSRGMAVDINPLYNPCVYVTTGRVLPQQGKPYAHDRSVRTDIPGKIDTSDLCYRLFRERGFRWGGSWRSLKDYHHFEK